MFRIQRSAVNHAGSAEIQMIPLPVEVIAPPPEPIPEPEPEPIPVVEVKEEIIKKEAPPVEPDASHPVLLAVRKKADEIIEAAQQQSGQIIEAARQESEQIIETAQQEREQAIAAANQEGETLVAQASGQANGLRQEAWQNGYIDGRAEAAAAATEQHNQALTDLLSVMIKLQDAYDKIYQDAEPEVLDLAIDIASKVLHTEIDRNDEVYSNMVHNVLHHIKREGKIVLRVSPSEYQRFFSSGEATYQVDGDPIRVSVVQEDGLESGACVIDSEGETVNGSIQSQIDRIVSAFHEMSADQLR